MQLLPRTTTKRATATVVGLAAALSFSACSVKEREPDQIAGKQAFTQKCGSCHVLSRAQTKGVTGPNLDEAFRQSLKDGLGDDSIRGVVRGWIDNPSLAGVAGSGLMPADLAKGEEADDIAAYVAETVARPGEDKGLLATAVKKAGDGKPVAAKGGVLSIAADPGGGLLYVAALATAEAGALKVEMPNESGVPHNIVIDGKGESAIIENGKTDFDASFDAGEFVYYCSVPGHRAAGMEGKLNVK